MNILFFQSGEQLKKTPEISLWLYAFRALGIYPHMITYAHEPQGEKKGLKQSTVANSWASATHKQSFDKSLSNGVSQYSKLNETDTS